MVQTFTCNVCGIVFNDEEKLRDHSQLHSSGSVHVSKALLYRTVSVLHHLTLSEPFPTETEGWNRYLFRTKKQNRLERVGYWYYVWI